MERASVDGSKFRTAFVVLLVALVSGLFLALAWPLLRPLMIGAILSGLCMPMFNWFARLFGGRRGLASIATLLVLFVIIAGPISAMLGLAVQQAVTVSDRALPWLQDRFGSATSFDANRWIIEHFPFAEDFAPSQAEIVTGVGNAVRGVGTYLVSSASSFTAGTAGFLLEFFVMIYAMFFFLKDGRQILAKIFYYMPLAHDDEERILERFISISRATIKGTLLIGLLQGTLGGLGFFFAGIGGAAFWGVIMVILSVIPGVGAGLVWVPAVIYLYVAGQFLPATLLLIWCATVVSTIDNVLRPRLVGQDAQMHDLMIFIGTLGGLFLFGPIGFVIGPVVCGLFLLAWEIYGAAFKDILPPVGEIRTSLRPAETIEVRLRHEREKKESSAAKRRRKS